MSLTGVWDRLREETFERQKRLGVVPADPMVICWPARIKDSGGLRSQFTHVTDIGPTILEMAGIPQPTHVDGVEQQAMTGVTFGDSLADPGAAEHHTQQYFENFGNRAMYKDGWWLSMRMPRTAWRLDPTLLKRFAPGVWDPDDDPVELYYLPDDFSQANDLAAGNPEKVKELQDLFWEEAEKYNIKPLLAGFSPFFGILPPLGTQTTTAYYGDVQNVAPGCVPRIYNHSYTISADLHIPDGGAEGVIVADANRSKADTVDTTLASAVRKSVAQVDGGGGGKLKAALAEAQAGMGG